MTEKGDLSSKIEAKSPGVEKLRTINYGGEPLYRASDADAEFRRLASPLAQAAPDLRRFLELAIARFKEADEERYAALMEFRKKSEKGKREGDWYGFNFYAGMDAGCNWASLMFNRVWRELDTLLKHLPERSAVETSARPTGPDFLHRWMRAKNPLLGDMAPLEMLKAGRGEKLARFIEEAAQESAPPMPCRGCGEHHEPPECGQEKNHD